MSEDALSTEEFIILLEGTYGAYTTVQRKLATDWAKKRSPITLKAVFEYVLRTHSLQFKSSPFLAEFEKAEEATLDEVERKVSTNNLLMIEGPSEAKVPDGYFEEFYKNLGKGPEALAKIQEKYFGGIKC